MPRPRRWQVGLLSFAIAILSLAIAVPHPAVAKTRYDPVLHATNGAQCENWLEGDRIVRVEGGTMRALTTRQTALRWRADIQWSYDQVNWTRLKLTGWQTRIMQPGQSTRFNDRGTHVTVGNQAIYIRVVNHFRWGTVTADDGFGRLLYGRRLTENSYWTRFYRNDPVLPGPTPWLDPIFDKGACFPLEDS